MANATTAGSGDNRAPMRPEFLSTVALIAALAVLATKEGAADDRALVGEAAKRLRALDVQLDAAHAASNTAPGELPLVLDGIVHVMRKKKVVEIKGPVFVSATDLTAAEIAELKVHGTIRLATIDEVLDAQKRASLVADVDVDEFAEK